MSKNIEHQVKPESALTLIIAALILLASLLLFYLNPLALQTLYKVLILLVGVVIAGLIFFISAKGKQLKAFLAETKIELRKVVWPTRDETIKTTGVILVAVVIVAIFLSLVDAFFTWAVQFLMN